LEKEPTDVSELARDVIRAVANEASSQGISLGIEIPTPMPSVDIDAVRFRQVLNNLRLNALQHTPLGGSIQTRVTATPQSDTLVEVHDTGSGMTQDEVERAFERFQRGQDPGVLG